MCVILTDIGRGRNVSEDSVDDVFVEDEDLTENAKYVQSVFDSGR